MNQKLLDKYLFLFGSGGLLYILIELIWRGYSHWTMFALGGICFVFLGLINEILPWQMPLWMQVVIGAIGITILEFLTGCVVNRWLGWGVWDYSNLPGNFLGQICPQYFCAWLFIALLAAFLDDGLRVLALGESLPHYSLF